MTGERGGVSPLLPRMASMWQQIIEQFDARLLKDIKRLSTQKESGGRHRPARHYLTS